MLNQISSSFFKRALLAAYLSLAAVVSAVAADAGAESPLPNILVIMVDDMGYSDLSSFGGEIPTHEIDSLADNGIRVLNFHNAARCCPSRVSLLNGLYSHTTGVGYMTHHPDRPVSEKEAGAMAQYRGIMERPYLTIAEAAKSAGYFTGMSGKWHMNPGDPKTQGFDRTDTVTYSGTSFFWPFDRSGSTRAGESPSEEELAISEATYVTEWYADGVLRYLRDAAEQEKPFMIYWAPTAPHYPLHALQQDVDRMKGVYDVGPEAIAKARYDRLLGLGIVQPDWPFEMPEIITNPDRRFNVDVRLDTDAWPPDPNYQFHSPKGKAMGSARGSESFEELMEIFAAQMLSLDRETGRVIDALRQSGALENTLILFFSDNGASREARITTLDTWAQVSNIPFPKYKRQNDGGGNRSPLIMHWPERIAPELRGSLSESYGHVFDVLPTILEMTGQSYPGQDDEGRVLPPLPGRSLLPILEGGQRELDEPLFFEHFGNLAVVTDEWKLVCESEYIYHLYNLNEDPNQDLYGEARHEAYESKVSELRRITKKNGASDFTQDGWRLVTEHRIPWRLYDLKNDPLEQVDLADEHPEVVKELATLWQAWADEHGARAAGNRRYGKDRLGPEDFE